MYDTTNFRVDRDSMAGDDPFAVLPYLCDIVERQSDRMGYSCSGRLGDYEVFCSQLGISLKGSLAKYYLPSNVFTLTRQTAAEALEKMGDELHIDMMAAKVTRLDVSTVMPVQRPPSDYYRHLGSKPRFTRNQATDNTLYYNQSSMKLVFYDKIKEANAKDAVIPASFAGCNLLRYEIRFLKDLPRLLDGRVTGATLIDSGFYHSIIQRWKDEFDTIKKVNRINIMAGNIKTPKDAKEALLGMLLQDAGQDIIEEYLSDLKASNTFSDPKYYCRLRAELNKIMQAPFEEKGDMIRELENAVEDVARYAR